MTTDLELLVQHYHLARRVVAHEPFKSALFQELDPGPDADTDSKVRGKRTFPFLTLSPEFVKKFLGSALR